LTAGIRFSEVLTNSDEFNAARRFTGSSLPIPANLWLHRQKKLAPEVGLEPKYRVFSPLPMIASFSRVMPAQ
jgi:hypothetical protein